MDETISQLLSIGTLTLAMVIVIGTFFIRRVVETLRPDLKKQADENAPGKTYCNPAARWWNQVVLYAIPEVMAILLGLWPSTFLYGENITTRGGRIMFGVVVAWFSATIYKVARKALASRVGIELGDDDDPMANN